MSEVFLLTKAYNAEKTLKRTIESVLSQTYSDFKYYIINNGSQDHTEQVIDEYSQQDQRIIKISRDINIEKSEAHEFALKLSEQHGSNGYFCTLDADDEYTPDFLEKMLSFMGENNLEVAACGNDFIDTQTNIITGIRRLEQHLILEGDGFGRHFQQYYQFMRTIWGKMYSLSVLKKCDFNIKIAYGSDTLFAINAFQNAKRVGILDESLHKYYISPKSISFQFNKHRIRSDQVLMDAAGDFLNAKCGTVTLQNLDFLFHVYLNAIRETINVLIKAQIGVTEKMNGLYDILKSRRTQELSRWPGTEVQKNELFHQVGVWLLSQEEVRSGTGMGSVADILAAMGMYPNRIDGWQDGSVFLLLAAIKDRMKEKGLTDGVDSQIVSILSNSQILAGLDAGFSTFFRDIVFSILQHDEKIALEQMEEIIAQEADIPNDYIEAFVTLGLKLSTKLEYTDDFIYFKKLQVSLLIDLSRIDDARAELTDWDEILPDDMDFKELRTRLKQ